MSSCRSCGARVRWARTYRGKRMPLDFEPNDAGNVVLVEGSTVMVARECQRAALIEAGISLYMPHHATCPQAGEWRQS